MIHKKCEKELKKFGVPLRSHVRSFFTLLKDFQIILFHHRRLISISINLIFIHSFLESMKLPSTQSANGSSTISAVTSTKPTSTFNICDILELNSKKKNLKEGHEVQAHAESCDEEEIHDEKKENLSGESEENLNDSLDEENAESNSKRKLLKSSSASPASQEESSQESPQKLPTKKSRKHSRSDESPQQPNSLLSDTLHQYPHLFQNHPAMRPWFSSNGKQPFPKYLIEHIKSARVMTVAAQPFECNSQTFSSSCRFFIPRC